MTNLAIVIEHQDPARYAEAEKLYCDALMELEKSPVDSLSMQCAAGPLYVIY